MNMSMFSRFTAGLRKVYRAVKKPVEKPVEKEKKAGGDAKRKRKRRPDDESASSSGGAGPSSRQRKRKRKFSIEPSMQETLVEEEGGGLGSSSSTSSRKRFMSPVPSLTAKHRTPSGVAEAPWSCILCRHKNKALGRATGNRVCANCRIALGRNASLKSKNCGLEHLGKEGSLVFDGIIFDPSLWGTKARMHSGWPQAWEILRAQGWSLGLKANQKIQAPFRYDGEFQIPESREARGFKSVRDAVEYIFEHGLKIPNFVQYDGVFVSLKESWHVTLKTLRVELGWSISNKNTNKTLTYVEPRKVGVRDLQTRFSSEIAVLTHLIVNGKARDHESDTGSDSDEEQEPPPSPDDQHSPSNQTLAIYHATAGQSWKDAWYLLKEAGWRSCAGGALSKTMFVAPGFSPTGRRAGVMGVNMFRSKEKLLMHVNLTLKKFGNHVAKSVPADYSDIDVTLGFRTAWRKLRAMGWQQRPLDYVAGGSRLRGMMYMRPMEHLGKIEIEGLNVFKSPGDVLRHITSERAKSANGTAGEREGVGERGSEEEERESSINDEEEDSDDGSDDGFVPDYSILDLDAPFRDIWYLLKQAGWSYCRGDDVYSFFYLRPGIHKKTEGVMGKTMFRNHAEVKAAIRQILAGKKVNVTPKVLLHMSRRRGQHAPKNIGKANGVSSGEKKCISSAKTKAGPSGQGGGAAAKKLNPKALRQKKAEEQKALKALQRKKAKEEKALQRKKREEEKALKALQRKKIEEEKALKRKKREEEKALKQKKIEEEKALEEKKIEEEKALRLKKIAEEKAKQTQKKIEWGNAWHLLKQAGWTHCSGDLVYPYYYLKEGVKKSTGVFGVDKFRTPGEVLEHCRKNDIDVFSRRSPSFSKKAARKKNVVIVTKKKKKGRKKKGHKLNLNGDWNDIWHLLKQADWGYVKGDQFTSYFFTKPGVAKKSEGVLGETMFRTPDDVIKHCKEIGMHNQPLDMESSEDEVEIVEVKRPAPKKKKRKFADSGKSKALKSMHTLFRKEVDIDGNWRDLWEDLVHAGWKWRAGVGDFKYMYFSPGANAETAKLGVDMFVSERDVIEYLRAELTKLAEASETADDDAYHQPVSSVNSVLDLNAAWVDIWYLLRQAGWGWSSGDKFHSYYYLKPDVLNKRSGRLGIDMFTSGAEVIAHLKKNNPAYAIRDSTAIDAIVPATPSVAPYLVASINAGSFPADVINASSIDDPVNFLCSKWPGRSETIQSLSSLVGEPSDWAQPLTLVYGGPATGKTLLVNDFFRASGVLHAVVDCMHIHKPQELFEITLNQIQSALRGNRGGSNSNGNDQDAGWDSDGGEETIAMNATTAPQKEAAASNANSGRDPADETMPDDVAEDMEAYNGTDSPVRKRRCNTMTLFSKHLVDLLQTDMACYLIFDNADRLHGLGRGLLPSIVRLQELTSRNIGVVFITQNAWEDFSDHTCGAIPVNLHIPGNSSTQIVELVSEYCPAHDDPEFFRSFVYHIHSVFRSMVNDVRELRYVVQLLYPVFRKVVAEEENKSRATAARGNLSSASLPTNGVDRAVVTIAQRRMQPAYRLAQQRLLLHDITAEEIYNEISSTCVSSSRADLIAQEGGRRAQTLSTAVELPMMTKFILIAAYLSSHNPADTDMKLFTHYRSGRRRKSRSHEGNNRAKNDKLRRPKVFPSERMFAIFISLVTEMLGTKEAERATTIDLYAQVASLVRLNLLAQQSDPTNLDQIKLICNVDLEIIHVVSRQIKLNLSRYLQS
jgi:origin recognition complex subunit 5